MSNHLKLPEIDTLNKSFNLDNGILTHKARFGVKEGQIAGNVMPSGYIRVNCGGKLYLAHRIIYKMHYGVDPLEKEVDHIDGDKANNHPSNLRLATRSQNRQNIGAYKNNKLKARGVWFDPRCDAFFCSVQRSKKRVQYGPFSTKEQASETYKTESKKAFGEFYPEDKI